MDDYSVVMNSVGIYGRGKFIKIGSLLYKKIITAQLLRSKTGYINSTLKQAT